MTSNKALAQTTTAVVPLGNAVNLINGDNTFGASDDSTAAFYNYDPHDQPPCCGRLWPEIIH